MSSENTITATPVYSGLPMRQQRRSALDTSCGVDGVSLIIDKRN